MTRALQLDVARAGPDPAVVSRIAARLAAHFHGDLYAPYAALGHDDVWASCNFCWISAEIAARAVTS